MAERHALMVQHQEQGRRLALSLRDTMNVVRSHVFVAQQTVEHALIRSTSSREDGLQMIAAESGALHADPRATGIDTQNPTAIAAAAMLPGAAANHQWHSIIQWTYFYDASGRWFLIYPRLSQDDLLKSTQTGDLSAAIRVFLEADGTRPLELVGPRSNPERSMRWTPAYEDAAGKGRMVTLLAPVYEADRFMGAVGTDVTLEQLRTVLRAEAPDLGRAVVVNPQGQALAGSDDRGPNVPADSANSEAQATLNLPIDGTPWTLRLDVTEATLLTMAVREQRAFLFAVAALVLALLGVLVVNHRRHQDLMRASSRLAETRNALIKADRMGGLGEMTALVGREVEVSLGKARQLVQQQADNLSAFQAGVERGLRRAELDAFIALQARQQKELLGHVQDAADVFRRLHGLAAGQALKGPREVHLQQVADSLLTVLRSELSRRGVVVENRLSPDLAIPMPLGSISTILKHMLTDAIARSADGQSISLAGGWQVGADGECLEVTLRDHAQNPPDIGQGPLWLACEIARQDLGAELTVQASGGAQGLVLRLPFKPQ